MGRRRRPLQYISDDDDDEGTAGNAAPELPTAPDSSRRMKHQRGRNAADEDDPELVEEEEDENISEDMERNDWGKVWQEETRTRQRQRCKTEGPAEYKDEDVECEEVAVPMGDPVRVTVKGKHYASFEYDGKTYKLEDQVMFSPAQFNDKPCVGIIKDISENDGRLSLSAQWFYRPHEARKKGGDPRELLYSFHIGEVLAESVMHRCVVHFIPNHKKIPNRKDQPGFIVQQIYEHLEKKLWNISDKDYNDDIHHEIDLHVKKTMDRIGELPERDPGNVPGANTGHFPKLHTWKMPRNLKDASRDAPTGKYGPFINSEMPGDDNLKNYTILGKYKAITGERCRDQWLDKFVDAILASKDNGNSYASDVVVSIVTALERSVHEALCTELQKYQQKMRALLFNIKKSSKLRRRLMNKELDPSVLLTMAPHELKDGLKSGEKMSEKEELRQLQMTEVRCARCTEKNVGITEVRHASCGDRYLLECISCGNSWHAFRDEIS